jgi:hypothetical protein
MMDGSGACSVPLTNGFGSGRSKNLRIRNTYFDADQIQIPDKKQKKNLSYFLLLDIKRSEDKDHKIRTLIEIRKIL